MQPPSRPRRALWFIALYIGGVAAVTLVAGLIKLIMPR
jgi:hypothetical protein